MHKKEFNFDYEVYEDIHALNPADADLLQKAREATSLAYAPYSHFNVAAIAMLDNGETVAGTNQENASYPVGTCAERVLLGSVAVQHPDRKIVTIAISYKGRDATNDHPISPCGMCRQALHEYEQRTHATIRLILGGMQGEVIILASVKLLLPLAFTSSEL